MAGASDERRRLSLLDLLRVFGGLLLANAFLSWWFTSSATWGYEGRWIDPKYVKFRLIGSAVDLSLDELSLYNGTDPALPIYLAIYGKVYDVSNGRSIYGPGGSYSFFSGRDSARAFTTGCFNKPDEFTYDLRGLDMHEALHDITGWQTYFGTHDRYWYVGEVRHEHIKGEPPAACEHMKFPGYYAKKGNS